MAELNLPVDEDTPTKWALSVDDASNVKGSGVGIVLEGPGDILIKQALKFEFAATNNQAKYESLITRMILALEMGAFRLKAKTNSHMVANQVSGHYQSKEP